MSGAPSRWTCELCGTTVAASQKGHHKKRNCPKQGNLLRAIRRQDAAVARQGSAPKPQVLPCGCACGAQIPQVKGQKKRHFLPGHYEEWRARQRAEEAQRKKEMGERAAEEAEREREERRLAEEMAPIVSIEEAVQRAVEAVPMVTGEASFLLWARCLGFAV